MIAREIRRTVALVVIDNEHLSLVIPTAQNLSTFDVSCLVSLIKNGSDRFCLSARHDRAWVARPPLLKLTYDHWPLICCVYRSSRTSHRRQELRHSMPPSNGEAVKTSNSHGLRQSSTADEVTPLLASTNALAGAGTQEEPALINGDALNGVNKSASAGEDDRDNGAEDAPLPKTQIALLCYTRLVEPIAFFPSSLSSIR